jgi:hypothetical protein
MGPRVCYPRCFLLVAARVATRNGQTLRASAAGYFFLRLFGPSVVGLRLAPIELAC